MSKKILFVDDDANLLDGIQRALRKQFSIDTALGGSEGLRRLATDGPYAVVVADMQMPEMSGLEFLRCVQTQAPDCVRMMLTGNSDLKTAVDAVNDGRVFRFLTKPCPPTTLAPALEDGTEHYRLMRAERDLLENTLGGAVKVLTEILSLADPSTFERSQKLKEYVVDFTSLASENASWELELAAMLSQIGRVTIPPAVLDKVREGITLTPPEKQMLENVPEFGARLIANIPRLENVADIVRHQSRHFVPAGIPDDSPTGEKIPIGARILHVLSGLIEFENRSFSKPAAFQNMRERTGWYDPAVFDAVSRWCDVSILDASGLPAPQSLRIEELRTGHILAEDIRTLEGMLMVANNTKLTPMLIVKLVNFRAVNTIPETLLVRIEPAQCAVPACS